jgi:hypothetical protein
MKTTLAILITSLIASGLSATPSLSLNVSNRIYPIGHKQATEPSSSDTICERSFVFMVGQQDAWLEGPPWVIDGGYYMYFFPTGYTTAWSSPYSMLDDNLPHVLRWDDRNSSMTTDTLSIAGLASSIWTYYPWDRSPDFADPSTPNYTPGGPFYENQISRCESIKARENFLRDEYSNSYLTSTLTKTESLNNYYYNLRGIRYFKMNLDPWIDALPDRTANDYCWVLQYDGMPVSNPVANGIYSGLAFANASETYGPYFTHIPPIYKALQGNVSQSEYDSFDKYTFDYLDVSTVKMNNWSIIKRSNQAMNTELSGGSLTYPLAYFEKSTNSVYKFPSPTTSTIPVYDFQPWIRTYSGASSGQIINIDNQNNGTSTVLWSVVHGENANTILGDTSLYAYQNSVIPDDADTLTYGRWLSNYNNKDAIIYYSSLTDAIRERLKNSFWNW